MEIKGIKLRELNILAGKEEFNRIIKIKVRSTGRLINAKINLVNNIANVEILDRETGISPGQACVFYNNDKFGFKSINYFQETDIQICNSGASYYVKNFGTTKITYKKRGLFERFFNLFDV